MAVGNVFYERVPQEGAGGAPARPGPAGQRQTGSEQVLGGAHPSGLQGLIPDSAWTRGTWMLEGCSSWTTARGRSAGDARLGTLLTNNSSKIHHDTGPLLPGGTHVPPGCKVEWSFRVCSTPRALGVFAGTFCTVG